jgi:hypothetical protein
MLQEALELVKARKGISTNVRDSYIEKIVEGVITELETDKHIELVDGNAYHLMFVVDLATWRYENRDEPGAMPRHLQFRLHNLIIGGGGSGA